MTELSLLGLSSSLRHASNSAVVLSSHTPRPDGIRTPYLTTSSAEIIEVVDAVRATSLGGAVA
jgi:hypothetical protein